MYSPWIGKCLGWKPPFLLHLLLIVQVADGSLHGINFLIYAFVKPFNSFVNGAFHSFYSLVYLSIDSFLLLHKIPYHFAQIHDSLLHR